MPEVNITLQFFELVDAKWMERLADDDTLDSEMFSPLSFERAECTLFPDQLKDVECIFDNKVREPVIPIDCHFFSLL